VTLRPPVPQATGQAEAAEQRYGAKHDADRQCRIEDDVRDGRHEDTLSRGSGLARVSIGPSGALVQDTPGNRRIKMRYRNGQAAGTNHAGRGSRAGEESLKQLTAKR